MNSENEKLRGLLQQALDMLEEQALHIEAPMLPAGEELLNHIRAALSQQAETVTAQDELLIKLADFARFVIKCVRRNGEYAPASMQEPHEIETLLAAAFAYRPAQTEQQPVLAGGCVHVPEARETGAWESARIGDFNAGWNACRDSVLTLLEKAAYMELDTTKRSIAIQDQLRATLAAPIAQTAAPTP